MQFGKTICVVGAVVALSVACGGSGKNKRSAPHENVPVASKGDAEPVLLEIPVALHAQLHLAQEYGAVDDFKIVLEGCASGRHSIASAAHPTLEAYKGDVGCLAKLVSLTLGGISYQQDPADPFDTYGVGDKAGWVAEGAAPYLVAVVTSQFADSIIDERPISYELTGLSKGNDSTIGGATIGSSHQIQIKSTPVPQFLMRKVAFGGVDNKGAGKFVFSLECERPLVQSGAEVLCGNLPLSRIRYQLLKDTFGSVLNQDQALEACKTAKQQVDGADVIQSGQADMANGGFVTKSDKSMLQGPAQMHLNPEMVLLLSVDCLSFQYFNIDVNVLTTVH
jgi:hypothetical protein